MKLLGASIFFAGFVLPLSFAQVTDHTKTVVCIPDKPIDSVLGYYVSSAEHPFCMNGGTCKQNFEENPLFPCDCPVGLTGPHCEFEEGVVPECELDCYNGGQCQAGIKYPSETVFRSNEDLQYCICPEGFYGKRCEVEGKQCGTAHCFNGGSCISIEQSDGTFTDHCDCTTAGDENVSYAGRFCQSPSTVFCSKFSDHNGKHFCVNGGECRYDSFLGCDCPQGFTGPVCEFREREEEDHSSCDLACQNNGICRKGSKDLSYLDNFNVNSPSHNDDFEHCVCPIGYVGLTCEIRLDVCPGGTHVCMHGAQCHPHLSHDTGKLEFRCDCHKADEFGLRYAGKYCQYESSEYCTTDGLRPIGESAAFCVNGGECLDFVPQGQEHPGCDCKDEYTGAHCEYPPEVNELPPTPKDSAQGGMAISLTLGFTLLVLLAVFFVVYRRQKQREKSFRPESASYYKDELDGDDSSSRGDLYDLGDILTDSTNNPPEISDLDYMVAEFEESHCTDMIVLDDNSLLAPSLMSSERNSYGCSTIRTSESVGTDRSSSSFEDDPTTGRSTLMKE